MKKPFFIPCLFSIFIVTYSLFQAHISHVSRRIHLHSYMWYFVYIYHLFIRKKLTSKISNYIRSKTHQIGSSYCLINGEGHEVQIKYLLTLYDFIIFILKYILYLLLEKIFAFLHYFTPTSSCLNCIYHLFSS